MHHVFCLQASDGCRETQNRARPHNRIVGSAIKTNRTEAVNLDQIPTPETDAVDAKQGSKTRAYSYLNMRDHAIDLERRLTEVKRLERERNETANTFMGQVKKLQAQLAIARETLIMIADESANLAHAERMADRALKQTAPKQ